MLQYLSHRFHCDGISFAVPEGFYLDDKTEDGAENGLLLLSPDQTFRLDIGIEHFVYPSHKELTDIVGEMGYQILSEIQPIAFNGLTGHHAAYRSQRHQYYEARFDLHEDQNGTIALVLLVSTDRDVLSIRDLPGLLKAIDPRPVP